MNACLSLRAGGECGSCGRYDYTIMEWMQTLIPSTFRRPQGAAKRVWRVRSFGGGVYSVYCSRCLLRLAPFFNLYLASGAMLRLLLLILLRLMRHWRDHFGILFLLFIMFSFNHANLELSDGHDSPIGTVAVFSFFDGSYCWGFFFDCFGQALLLAVDVKSSI